MNKLSCSQRCLLENCIVPIIWKQWIITDVIQRFHKFFVIEKMVKSKDKFIGLMVMIAKGNFI